MSIEIVDVKKQKRGRPKKIVESSSVIPTSIRKSYLVILNVTLSDIKYYKISKNNNSTSIDFASFFNDELYDVPILKNNIPIKFFDEEFNNNEIDNIYNNIDDSKKVIHNNNYEFVFKKNTNNNTLCELLQNSDGKWPTSSPYLCWNCGCKFEGRPLAIPKRIYKDKIFCDGNFCDWGCLLRYIYEKFPRNEYFEMYEIIFSLFLLENNDIDKELKMAMPILTMAKYGGYLSDEEYHNYHKINNDSLIVCELPLVANMSKIYKIDNTGLVVFNDKKKIKEEFINDDDIKEKDDIKYKNIMIDENLLNNYKEIVKNLKKK